MNVRTKNLLRICQLLEDTANKNPKWRPCFHISPPTGWMNDPNGLCQFGVVHHVFFQYSPFDVKPGLNYWGHYETKDFVHYVYQKPALCSDEQFDCHGVYSGSALIADETMYLFYTGNVKKRGDDYDFVQNGREHNTIRAEGTDGVTFDEKTLLLANSDYPKNVTCHVRDPKVWKDDKGCHMVLGARRSDDIGEILVYHSADKHHWKLENEITTQAPFGYMWECPDYFTLDDVQILSFSPQGVEPQGWRYNNIYQSGYCRLTGAVDGTYALSEFQEYDHGFDFYAPQTYEDHQGRRILIGWMGMPDSPYRYAEQEYGWSHMMTIPRVLTYQNGQVYQNPLPELQALRGDAIQKSVVGSYELRDITVFEADIQHIEDTRLLIRFGSDGELTWEKGTLSLRFEESGYGRTLRRIPLEHLSRIQLFCDTSSIEVFANDGEAVFSSRFYAEPEDSAFSVTVKKADVTVWKLNPIQIRKG